MSEIYQPAEDSFFMSDVLEKFFESNKKDIAVLEIIKNPFIGQEKRGNLSGIFIYKFILGGRFGFRRLGSVF